MMNLIGLKNDTARQNAIRSKLAEVIAEAVKTEFGEDAVLFIEKKLTVLDGDANEVAEIPSNSIVVKCGEVKAKNGEMTDAVAVIGATVKSWDTKKNKSQRVTYAVRFDDIVDSLAEQQTELAEKSKKSKDKEKSDSSDENSAE